MNRKNKQKKNTLPLSSETAKEIPGFKLCLMISTRSRRSLYCGHQISVNLLRRAGESCKKKQTKLVFTKKKTQCINLSCFLDRMTTHI